MIFLMPVGLAHSLFRNYSECRIAALECNNFSWSR